MALQRFSALRGRVPVELARAKAREILKQSPQGDYLTIVDQWRGPRSRRRRSASSARARMASTNPATDTLGSSRAFQLQLDGRGDADDDRKIRCGHGAQCGTVATIDPAKIDAFARLMTENLDNGDTNARKGYIRSIVDAIEVDDKAIRIIGNKDVLQAVIAGKQNANSNVRGFVRKWRAIQNKTASSYSLKSLYTFLATSESAASWASENLDAFIAFRSSSGIRRGNLQPKTIQLCSLRSIADHQETVFPKSLARAVRSSPA
jgi:hypothetical protein